jgi:hypothetical protein
VPIVDAPAVTDAPAVPTDPASNVSALQGRVHALQARISSASNAVLASLVDGSQRHGPVI